MVHDDIVVVERTEAVPAVIGSAGSGSFSDILVAQAEAHVAHDNIVTLDGTGAVGNTDAVAGG